MKVSEIILEVRNIELLSCFQRVPAKYLFLNKLKIDRLINNNGSVNGAEKIEAERKRDADPNVVRIRICVFILHIQFVVSLRIRLIKIPISKVQSYTILDRLR